MELRECRLDVSLFGKKMSQQCDSGRQTDAWINIDLINRCEEKLSLKWFNLRQNRKTRFPH